MVLTEKEKLTKLKSISELEQQIKLIQYELCLDDLDVEALEPTKKRENLLAISQKAIVDMDKNILTIQKKIDAADEKEKEKEPK